VIDIVFRNLMFFYNGNDGLHVFVPSTKHRAHLLDTWTGAKIPLSQSHIYLEIDGKVISSGTPLYDPDERVVTIEWLADMPKGSLPAPTDLMDVMNVPESLCAHVTIGGGTLTAYPLSMFPEKAETPALFERTLGQPEEHLITDTLVYHLDISSATKARLIVTGPRRARVVFDVLEGARFEICNEDDLIGLITTEAEHRQEEIETIFDLLELGAPACNIHGCAGFYGGDPDAGEQSTSASGASTKRS